MKFALLFLCLVVPWARALPAAAGDAAAEEPASMSDVLEAAAAEAAAGSEVAVVATADTEPASGGDGAAATVVEVDDPQDSAAAESDSEAAKSKRTVASSLGYGAYPGYNALPHDAPPRHHAHHFHAQAAASHQQPQYNVPAQAHAQGQQQYQTVRYYPTKGSAVAEEAPRARPEYQIQYQYQLPAQYQPAHHVQQYYSVPQHLLAAASGQQLVYQHPAAAPPAAVPAAHSLFGGQQLIPVILVRVADPSQHGLASAALLPASALGLHAPHAAPAPAPAAHGLSLQALQSLILQHYAQQAPAAPAHAPQAYYTETPQLTQQQLKQLYAQQQAAAAAAASEGKKPIIPSAAQSSSAPQKPRKGASVSIEAAHNLDNSYQQYKFSNYKDKN